MSKATAPLILVVEDEPAQSELLAYNIDAAGYRLAVAADGEEALLLIAEAPPDLIVLDWMLPLVSGIEVCRRLKTRQSTKSIPIIMLTARNEEVDRIRGLETGADDYVVKPYSINELMARIRAILRRSRPGSDGSELRFGELLLDGATHKASLQGKALKLGPIEFDLLATFMERPQQVWTRDQLLTRVWGRDSDIDTRTVDVHIARLRKVMAAHGGGNLIRTVRGTGYSLDDEG